MKFSATSYGFPSAQRLIDAVTRQIKDVTRPLEQAREEVRNEVYENFQTNGGGTWAPRKKNYPHPPLRKTQRMYLAAIAYARGAAIQKSGLVTTVDFRGFSEVTPYAKYHLTGTTKTHKMAARPFAPAWRKLSAIRQSRIRGLLQDHIMRF